jgi:hypothetical protein
MSVFVEPTLLRTSPGREFLAQSFRQSRDVSVTVVVDSPTPDRWSNPVGCDAPIKDASRSTQ